MGVHDIDKYPEIKRLLGIPEDEPIFIFRAQDAVSVAVLNLYDTLYQAAAKIGGIDRNRINFFSDHLHACSNNFLFWQRKNRLKVKIPD